MWTWKESQEWKGKQKYVNPMAKKRVALTKSTSKGEFEPVYNVIHATPCIVLVYEMQKIKFNKDFFGDQMQEWECKDKIRVYHNISLHWDKCRCEGNTTQHKALHHIVRGVVWNLIKEKMWIIR